MSTPIETPEHRLDVLERRAKVVRSRLMRTVDALDARRHQVENIGEQAKKLAVPAAVGVAGVALLFGVSLLAFGAAVRSRRQRSVGARIAKAIRGLDLAPRKSFGRQLAEKVVMSAVTFAATELLRRATKNVVDGRLPDGRLAVGQALETHHRELVTQ